MPNWITHLTAAERRQLEQIEQRRSDLMAEKLRLHDMAKKRKRRAKAKLALNSQD